jgi:transcriptional regulator with XRE-family HTH domain
VPGKEIEHPDVQSPFEQPDDPELPTSPLWRQAMYNARRAAGMSQAKLGAAVGVSQAVISSIETGDIASSKKVMAICRVLKIPPPIVMVDPDIERLVVAALALRSRNAELFTAQLMLLENLAGIGKTAAH